MTYVVEQAPDRKRGMVIGFLPMGNLSGFVLAPFLATGLQSRLSPHDMLTWGWRIPLLLSAPFGLVALYLRLTGGGGQAVTRIRAVRRNGAGSP